MAVKVYLIKDDIGYLQNTSMPLTIRKNWSRFSFKSSSGPSAIVTFSPGTIDLPPLYFATVELLFFFYSGLYDVRETI